MHEAPGEATNRDDTRVGETARSITGLLKAFGNGEMAALRRLDDDAPAPAYWRLAARHPVLADNRSGWMPIVRALAILTPKGQRRDRHDEQAENQGNLHDPKRKLGTALCDGGVRDWPGSIAPGTSPRPLISEQRLAQLLAARGSQRTALLLRAIRALAAHRDPNVGLDVGDLAWRFLDPDPAFLAAPYYLRLDRAERATKAEQSERTTDA